ncbi:hypothetical protein [uncultured Dokdonia sp.]|uniref:hypothetical protein n=1 Tax=uncultured Dokdonia sp. TaxID=575653 RepID=UPI0026227A97|nr:hypothetical protein [uncultured Dokdonia sp.]
MKTFLLLICLTFLGQLDSFAQETVEIGASESMLLTGKGQGQDGVINPYDGKECYAIISNSGSSHFILRIQQEGKIIDTIEISSHTPEKIKLLKNYELYIDAGPELGVTATITFEPLKEDDKSESKY